MCLDVELVIPCRDESRTERPGNREGDEMKRIVITLLVAAILGGIAAYWWLLREPGPANVWELQVYGDDDKYAKVSTFRDVSTSLGDA